jgi:hypothetical protein
MQPSFNSLLLSSVLVLVACGDSGRPTSPAATATGEVEFHISRTEPLPPIGDAGSISIGVARFEVTATVVNRSKSSKWVFGHSVSSPFYSLSIRPSPASNWEDEKIGFCGTGTGFRELPSGHFTTFKLLIRGLRIGSEARFGLTVFDAPDDSSAHRLNSNIITIGE